MSRLAGEEVVMLPAFSWQAVATQWEFAPAVSAAVAVAAGLYLWGSWRVRREHPARPWPRWRTGMFFGGLAVIVIATQSGIGAYDDVLFWDHMIQHLLLLMVAPPLLVIGQPVTLLLHASRNPLHSGAKRVVRSRLASFLTWPLFGFAAYTATVVITHLTGLANVIVTNRAAHDAEHVLYLAVGYLFFLPLLGQEPIRWRVSYPLRLLVLVIAMPVDTFTGLVLGYEPRGFAVGGPLPPGSPSPVTDAHWAGALMWIGGDAIMLGFMMVVVLLWSRDDRAGGLGHGWLEAARTANFESLVGTASPAAAGAGGPAAAAAADGTASDKAAAASAGSGDPARRGGRPARDIDDDEHLAAYNAYLARLHRSGS
ncbi:MAG: cytochrome c oxidase assembly protein [Actinobacteria bacterium]|nr:cytochrome c oxidase assembly protein [Actinomycetota bacterium]